MSRGRSVSETGARHLTTEEYRRMLSEECTTFEENIDRHRKVLFSIQSDIRLAERRVKGLTTMVDNLEKSKAESRRSYRQPNAIWQPTATMRRSWRC